MFTTSVIEAIAGVVFLVLLTVGSVWDLRQRRIPNRLVLVLGVCGAVYSVAAHRDGPAAGLARAVQGMALGLALWLPFYALRMLGAGDVKFFAAAAAWLGPATTLRAAALAALAGGMLGLLWPLVGSITRRWRAVPLRDARPTPIMQRGATSRAAPRLPYGVAMAVGLASAAWFPNLLW